MRRAGDRALRFLAAALLPLSVGCEGDTRSAIGDQRRDSAGVEIVVSGSESRFFELEETLRIGVVAGDPNYQFDRIGGIDVAPDGRVLVANHGSSSLRMYSPDEEFMLEIGGPGDGPGEFRFLVGGTFVGDSIAAVDVPGPRVAIFDEDGQLGRTVSLSERVSFAFGMTLTDSVWYARYRNIPSSSVPDGEVVPIDWAVHRVDRGTGELGPALYRAPGGVGVGIGGEFRDAPLLDPSPIAQSYRDGGSVVPAGDSYELRILDDAGVLTRIIRRAHTPVPITDDDRDRYRSEVTAYSRAEDRSPGSLDAALDMTPQSDVIPPISSIAEAEDGGLWIRRRDYGDNPFGRIIAPRVGADPSSDPVLWDGFAEDGSYAGSIWIPSNFGPRVWGDGWVIGVLENELDVQFVARYEIVEAGTG